jgi:hypothetical protein
MNEIKNDLKEKISEKTKHVLPSLQTAKQLKNILMVVPYE